MARWQVAAIVSAATAIALVMAFVITPVYRAEVLLVPVDEKEHNQLSDLASKFGGLASFSGFSSNLRSSTTTSLAILKTRKFTVDFLRENSLLPILFSRDWDLERGQWKSDKQGEYPTYWQGYKYFDDKVRRISEDPDTGLITVSVEWSDPELAADWANKLVARLNAHLRQRAVHESKQSLEYLRNQLKKTSSVEVRDAIFSLIESEMKKSMLANVREEFAFQVLDAAVPPEEPVRPRRVLIVALGILLGGVSSVFWAISRALLRK